MRVLVYLSQHLRVELLHTHEMPQRQGRPVKGLRLSSNSCRQVLLDWHLCCACWRLTCAASRQAARQSLVPPVAAIVIAHLKKKIVVFACGMESAVSGLLAMQLAEPKLRTHLQQRLQCTAH